MILCLMLAGAKPTAITYTSMGNGLIDKIRNDAASRRMLSYP